MHVGSLRGPVILDVIARALRAHEIETTYLYGVDDMDPMDAQALLTPDAVDRYMGAPLAHIPDQADDGHETYARHHGADPALDPPDRGRDGRQGCDRVNGRPRDPAQ